MIYRVLILFLLSGLFVVSCGQNTAVPNDFGKEVVTEYYPDSVKKVSLRYSESDTSFVLQTKYYHSGAKYWQGVLHHGLRQGKWTAWGEKGQVLTTGNYDKGVQQGLKIVYFDNGKKRYEGMFENDKRVGVWKFWTSDGKLAKEIDYDKR